MKRYSTVCFKCQKKISRTHFDIVLGADAAFLCEKHYKEVYKWLGL
jgi:hypothetical protein